MPHLKVFIKWGRQSLSDLFVDPEQPPLVLKTELCKLTGVQPERQRLLLQGTALKDDTWGRCKLRDGANLILIGSPGDLPSEPVKKTTFIEDLTSVQMGLSVDVPTGLMNMGNSCFLNATLQCLRMASPLHDALCRFKVSSINDPAQRFAAALADLYLSMDRITMQRQADGEDDRVTQESHDIQALHEIMTCGGQRSLFDQVVDRTAMDLQWQKPVQVAVPVAVLKALQQSEPAFAEIGSDGLYVQQDALHCWCKILQLLREVLEGHRSWRELEDGNEDDEEEYEKPKKFIDQFFGIEMKTESRCSDSRDTNVFTATEQRFLLRCQWPVDHSGKLLTTLQAGLMEETVRYSEILKRAAIYSKKCTICRLPAYLSVQLLEAEEETTTEIPNQRDKRVPQGLDMLEMCTEELQTRLALSRKTGHKQQDSHGCMQQASLAIAKAKHIEEGYCNDDTSDKTSLVGHLVGANSGNLDKALASFRKDVGSNQCGCYNLHAVLTQRRSSPNSVCYAAWILKPKEGCWLCQDEDIMWIPADDVINLANGWKSHVPYLLLYGPCQDCEDWC